MKRLHPRYQLCLQQLIEPIKVSACCRLLMTDPTGNEPSLPGDDDVQLSILVSGQNLRTCNKVQVPPLTTVTGERPLSVPFPTE